MILQGESYEFGTVFQTVAFFMFVIPRLRPGLLSLRSVLSSRQILLLVGCCLLDVACWMLLVGSLLVGSLLVGYRLLARCLLAIMAINQTTKSQNNKTTRQQKKRVSQPSYLMELSSLKSKTIHAERSISIMVPRAKPG